MEYLIILILLFLLTLFLEIAFRIHLYNSIKERIIIPVSFVIIGFLWESFALYRYHWTFEGPGLIGINFLSIPIEEYLFFLIVPYFILTLYKVITKEIEKKSKKNKNNK
jgi:lycopene cyclase domain-containing protein